MNFGKSLINGSTFGQSKKWQNTAGKPKVKKDSLDLVI
jgi:hypothetical protein